MEYELLFHTLARREWNSLGDTIREDFKKKLAKRLSCPRVGKDALRGMPDHYKIKLRQVGYRLIYRVDDGSVSVLVIAVGKRDKKTAYKKAADRQ